MNSIALYESIQIITYISNHKDCVINDLKQLLDITPSNPPSPEEKSLYYLIQRLTKEGLIQKVSIKNMRPGGPHYTLCLASKGILFIEFIKDLFDDKCKSSNLKIENLLEEINEISMEFINNLFSDSELKKNNLKIPNLEQEIQRFLTRIKNLLIDIFSHV